MKKLIYFLIPIVAVIGFLGFSIGISQAGPCELPVFIPNNFPNAPAINPIDNPYFTLSPGTTFVYEPVPNEEDDVEDTVTVTDCNKTITIGGKIIQAVVVYDVETVGNLKSEETWDYYAQDDDGNVWYLGEYTKAYDYPGSANYSTEGSWEAGQDVLDDGRPPAEPGYVMLAESRVGECYQQEYYEDEAEDKAKVLRLNAKVILESEYSDLEADTYDNCLVTKEWTPLSPGDVEHKYYKKGVGLVLIQELKEKTVRVELVSIESDGPACDNPIPPFGE